MKGVSLAIKVALVLLISIVVVVALIILVLQAQGTADIILVQSVLRTCCSDRSIWDCGSTAGVQCSVPWSDNPETLAALQIKALVTDLPKFCNCP